MVDSPSSSFTRLGRMLMLSSLLLTSSTISNRPSIVVVDAFNLSPMTAAPTTTRRSRTTAALRHQDLSSSTAPTTTTCLRASSSPISASVAAGVAVPLPTADNDTRTERLSDEEQLELLKQVVEVRRISNIEKELALKMIKASNGQPTQLAVCRAAGYGDDLYAYENAVEDGHRARETLVTRSMGLVYHCVNSILGTKKLSLNKQLRSLSREDLIQEGAIGLARAADKWNPEIGGKFSTYSYYWIRAAVLRCIAEHDDTIRVPEHVSAAVRKMTKAAKALGLAMDEDNILSSVYSSSTDPSSANWKEAQAAKALAEEAGLSDRQLLEAMKVQRRRRRNGIMSFESWMQQGKDYETDLMTTSLSQENDDASAAGPLPSSDAEDLKQTLGRFLRPKELEALSWRYGLTTTPAATTSATTQRDYVAEAESELFGQSPQQQQSDLPVRGKGGEAMSFVEVGKKMQVSGEYVRRLCHRALDKLRQAAEEGTLLEPALSF